MPNGGRYRDSHRVHVFTFLDELGFPRRRALSQHSCIPTARANRPSPDRIVKKQGIRQEVKLNSKIFINIYFYRIMSQGAPVPTDLSEPLWLYDSQTKGETFNCILIHTVFIKERKKSSIFCWFAER